MVVVSSSRSQEADKVVAIEACTHTAVSFSLLCNAATCMADGGETLKKAVEALINDKSFDLSLPLAKVVHDIAVQFLQWISVHKDQAHSAEKQIKKMLTSCFKHKRKRQAA